MTRRKERAAPAPAEHAPRPGPSETGDQAPPATEDAAREIEPDAKAPEEFARLSEDLERLRHREDELLRAVAELTNAHRRRKQEMETSIAFAQESLVRELLPVLDDLERALAAFTPGEEDPLRAGVALVCERLKRTLERQGLEAIAPAEEAFDPEQHEAVAHRESPGVPSGRVLEVAQTGYRFRGRVLRPARVVVS